MRWSWRAAPASGRGSRTGSSIWCSSRSGSPTCLPTGIPSLRTERLTLVPATPPLLDADLESSAALARRLDAIVPESWSPGEYDRGAAQFFRDRLAEDPGSAGWYGWYAIWRPEDRLPILIGMVGFMGPPDPAGQVEIGYSIATEFRAG
ncbi:MAG TPA: GNAT family N-acetyltransferase, partial [Candidatus Eisenbacteria bacterium]